MEVPIYTIDPVDHSNKTTLVDSEAEDYIYYQVIYYDTSLKYKSKFVVPIKKGEDIMALIRCYIALEDLMWKYKIMYPFVHETKKIPAYIEFMRAYMELPAELIDLFSIAERVFHPKDFHTRFEFDFHETNLRESKRNETKFQVIK